MEVSSKRFFASQEWRLRRWRNIFLSRCSILLATFCGLSGIRMAWFGLRCARACREKGLTDIADEMIITPVNCVRYFEFDFARRSLRNCGHIDRALDISSPNLLGLYLLNKKRISHLDVVNPAPRELDATRAFYGACLREADAQVKYHEKYVKNLDWPDKTFDAIWSLSVIEHIPGSGDEEALLQIERLLKPGGILVLTVPVCAYGWDEYRDRDVYHLPEQNTRMANGVFFQRWYDKEALNGRILGRLSRMRLQEITFLGETRQGWFDRYERSWIKQGASETCKDAFYMLVNFRKFHAVRELPGAGVACMRFERCS